LGCNVYTRSRVQKVSLIMINAAKHNMRSVQNVNKINTTL
jgi:hypothetical protein